MRSCPGWSAIPRALGPAASSRVATRPLIRLGRDRWNITDGTGLLEAEVPHRYDIHGVLVDLPRVSVRADGGRDEVTGFAMRGDLFPLTDVPVG